MCFSFLPFSFLKKKKKEDIYSSSEENTRYKKEKRKNPAGSGGVEANRDDIFPSFFLYTMLFCAIFCFFLLRFLLYHVCIFDVVNKPPPFLVYKNTEE